jgi:hypothetical protein
MDKGFGYPCASALVSVALVGLAASAASAATYDEAVRGDLSNNRLSPTDFVLDFSRSPGGDGRNLLIGSTGATSAVNVDRDYLHIVVPEHFALVALRVESPTTVIANSSFIGIAAGKTITTSPTANTAAGLLGWKLYAANLGHAPVDILGDLRSVGLNTKPAVNLGAVWRPPKPCPIAGNPGCLAAGDYTLWIQENATGKASYRFDLILAPVPEAPTLPLWSGGLAAVGLLARGRRRRMR